MTSSQGLSRVVREAQQLMDAHRPFSVHQKNGELSIALGKISSATQAIQTATDLVNAALERLKVRNLKMLPPEEKEGLRDLVDIAYKYIKEQSKKYAPQGDQAVWKNLQAFALSAKLGGKILPQLLQSPQFKDYSAFLQANHIHHKVQALYQQLDALPGIMVEGQTIAWDLIDRREDRDAWGNLAGYTFSYQSKELFKTDRHFQLTAESTYTHEGIIHYNPIFSPEVRAYDKQEADGKYHVEIWTALYDVTGERPVITIGDHSYLVLIDDQGNRYGVGQYGMAEDFGCQHALSACGRKKGGIETPDRYLFLPKDSHSFKKTEVDIAKQDFERLMEKIRNDKVDPNMSVSILKGNCTSYVKALLATIGVNAESEMGFFEVLVRKFAPISWVKQGDVWWDSVKDKVPKMVKKALYFIPPVYVVNLIMGLFFWIGSRRNFKNQSPDIGLIDVIFRPWNFWGHHPKALRRWQDKLPEKIDISAFKRSKN